MAPELLKKLFGCQANEKVIALKIKCQPRLTEDTSHLYRVQCQLFARTVLLCAVLLSETGFTVSTGINGFVEPNFNFYEVDYPLLDQALANFQANLPFNAEEKSIIARCRERRISRILLSEERARQTVWDSAFLTENGPDIVTDVPRPRDCLGKIDALALRHLCYSVSAGAGKKGRAYFCSSYEILS